MLKELSRDLARRGNLSWFAQMVERGRHSPFSEIVTLTPDIARHILDGNTDNRKVSYKKVTEIAKDILAGRWKVNGETIIIASDGSLNDGQHRCWAVVEAGTPIKTMMAFGIERESRFTVDTGVGRTVSGFLGMQGIKNAAHVGSITRLYDSYSRKLYYRVRDGQTSPYILEVYKRNEKEINEAASRATVCTAKDSIARFAGVPAWGLAFMLCYRANPEMAEVFFARLSDGVGLERDDPILALRSRLMAANDARLMIHEKCALILIHWNTWRRGIPVKKTLRSPKSWPVVER